MDGSIDGTGSVCQSAWQMELEPDPDPETGRLLAAATPAIEGALFDVLAMEPGAPACVGVIAADGAIRVAKATTPIGYRQAAVPDHDKPERALWEGLGAAFRQPMVAGREYVMLAEHRSPDTVTVRLLSMQTTVRATVQRLLGGATTPDEQIAARACEALSQPAVAGPTVLDCIEQVDAQLAEFESEMDRRVSEARRSGAPPTAHGREVLRWWSDESRRAPSRMRQRALLVLLLRAGLVADAEWLQSYEETIRSVVLPPPTTARNTEVLGMSAAVLLHEVEGGRPFTPERLVERTRAISHLAYRAQGLFRLAGLVRDDGDESLGVAVVRFLEQWRLSAFARLEVSHKLAAALCLTDVPEDTELHAPWAAWSLVLPDGLLGSAQPARVWCLGLEPALLVTPQGKVEPWADHRVGGPAAATLLRSLVRAVCVVLSDPDRRKADGRWGGTAAKPPRGQRPPGAAPDGARYLLAQPVTIDLRETLREALAGKRHGGGGVPKHQFLVRGHPRQQAWGPQHSLRRYKWIEPYWKGDPDARILLRGHRVQDD